MAAKDVIKKMAAWGVGFSTKTTIKLEKTIRINYSRTLKLVQTFTAIREELNEGRGCCTSVRGLLA